MCAEADGAEECRWCIALGGAMGRVAVALMLKMPLSR